MSNKEFIPPELDEEGIEFMHKIKSLLDGAFKEGYMEGVKSVIDDSKSDPRIRRICVTPSGMLAFLIILLGGIFSLGMYIGGLNG